MSKTVKNRKPSRNGSPKNITIEIEQLRALQELVSMEKNERPPKWLAVAPEYREVRFGVVANQAETDFTVRNLLYCQCSASSATVISPLAYAVRLRRVRIWFCSPTLGTNISSTVEWTSAGTGFLQRGTALAEVNTSTTEMVCLDVKPPKQSLARWYQAGVTGATNILFSFSAPAGAIMQLDFNWVPNFTEGSYETQTTAGAVTNTLYCRAVNANVLALPPLNSTV
jgi:hypothetical protein